MPEINLPTKATQDAIKTKTDLIGSPNPTTADTTTIMNYLKQLENKVTGISGGTDWSKYAPLAAHTSITVGAGNTLPIINVTGNGFVSLATLYSSNCSSAKLRITIDGVIKHSSIEGAGIVQGLTVPEYLSNAGSSALGVIMPTIKTVVPYSIVKPYPLTGGAAGVAIIDKPIFFNNSLLVELINGDSYSRDFHCSVIGGILK